MQLKVKRNCLTISLSKLTSSLEWSSKEIESEEERYCNIKREVHVTWAYWGMMIGDYQSIKSPADAKNNDMQSFFRKWVMLREWYYFQNYYNNSFIFHVFPISQRLAFCLRYNSLLQFMIRNPSILLFPCCHYEKNATVLLLRTLLCHRYLSYERPCLLTVRNHAYMLSFDSLIHFRTTIFHALSMFSEELIKGHVQQWFLHPFQVAISLL